MCKTHAKDTGVMVKDVRLAHKHKENQWISSPLKCINDLHKILNLTIWFFRGSVSPWCFIISFSDQSDGFCVLKHQFMDVFH